MTSHSNSYNWSEHREHYWLATDREHHVALVSCSDSTVLPSSFLLDWRWLSGIDERLAEYYSESPCRGIAFHDLSNLLRQKGFFIIDSCRLGKESKIEYSDPLSTPISLNDIPYSFKILAQFFSLPNASFVGHHPIKDSDWKADGEPLQEVNLIHAGRSLSFNPDSRTLGDFTIRPNTPREGRRFLEYHFLEFRFLPDSNLSSENFLSTPHITCWTQYYSCFKTIVEALLSFSKSNKMEFVLRDGFSSKPQFNKLENEPPLAIRYFRGQSLTTELLLKEAPPNGLTDNVSNAFAFALFAPDSVQQLLASSLRDICSNFGIAISMSEDEPIRKGVYQVWKGRIKNFLLLALCSWFVAGLLVPMRLMPLLFQVKEFQDGRIGPDGRILAVTHPPKLGFGVRFYQQGSGITWLNEEKSKELCRNICKGKLSFSFGESDVKYGVLYVIPQWLNSKATRTIFYPFVHMAGIVVYYYPNENLLYMSEDRSELNYDFCKGLNVSNVPPDLIHFTQKQSPKE